MVASTRFWLAFSAAGVGLVALVACTEPEGTRTGGSGASAGQASAGQGGDTGQGAGAGQSAATGPGGSPGDEGGQTGEAGSGQAHAGQSAAAGSANASCVPPDTVPVGGAECVAGCVGKTVAYEDCDGDGLVQAACGGAWFILQSACGDHTCQAAGFEQQMCGSGSVCMELVGGAHLLECRAHSCGTGPITCDCLKDACPGTCTQTGPLDFSCNTCPSGDCP